MGSVMFRTCAVLKMVARATQHNRTAFILLAVVRSGELDRAAKRQMLI